MDAKVGPRQQPAQRGHVKHGAQQGGVVRHRVNHLYRERPPPRQRRDRHAEHPEVHGGQALHARHPGNLGGGGVNRVRQRLGGGAAVAHIVLYPKILVQPARVVRRGEDERARGAPPLPGAHHRGHRGRGQPAVPPHPHPRHARRRRDAQDRLHRAHGAVPAVPGHDERAPRERGARRGKRVKRGLHKVGQVQAGQELPRLFAEAGMGGGGAGVRGVGGGKGGGALHTTPPTHPLVPGFWPGKGVVGMITVSMVRVARARAICLMSGFLNRTGFYHFSIVTGDCPVETGSFAVLHAEP